MKNEKRVFKQAIGFARSALDILEGLPNDTTDIQMLQNAAAQAQQAAAELNQLIGMLSVERPPVKEKKQRFVFEDAGSLRVPGRGIIWTVRNPSDCTSFTHLIDQIAVLGGLPFIVTSVEFSTHFDGRIKKGDPIGLIVRPFRPDEEARYQEESE